MKLVDIIPGVADLKAAVENFWAWTKNTFSAVWACVIAAILVPLNWVVQTFDSWVATARSLWAQANDQLSALGVFDIGTKWGQFGAYMDRANALMPVNLAVSLFMSLLVLWAICQIVRIAWKYLAVN
jgi:hypothetical protein